MHRVAFHLDPRELDHLGPLLDIVGNELGEARGRTCKHSVAKVGKPRHDYGISEACVDFCVKPADNLSWGILGCAKTIPSADLKARQELAHSRDVWQYLRT